MPASPSPLPQRPWFQKRPAIKWLLLWLIIAWALEIIDFVIPGRTLDGLGIRPRELIGLPGILLAPWLHGDFRHLIGNTTAFLPLGLIVLAAEKQRFIPITLGIITLSGIGVWLIGSPGVHIGASGLIYGYFGYIIGRAWRERKSRWLIIGIITALFYGGMIFGIFPKQGMSWEGHLCGLLAGFWLSGLQKKRTPLKTP